MKRLLSYVVVIRPLVMRAVAKSETLALSMELKGSAAILIKICRASRWEPPILSSWGWSWS